VQYDYSTVLEKVFQFYDAERLGRLPQPFSIPWRHDSLMYQIGPRGLGFGNVTGGWVGGGNAGTVQNTIPAAMTIAMMAWGLLEFPEVPPPHPPTHPPPLPLSMMARRLLEFPYAHPLPSPSRNTLVWHEAT